MTSHVSVYMFPDGVGSSPPDRAEESPDPCPPLPGNSQVAPGTVPQVLFLLMGMCPVGDITYQIQRAGTQMGGRRHR